MPKESFVATATAIALLVDVFRMPVYAATQRSQLRSAWLFMLITTGGVIAGTLLGQPLLKRIPAGTFRSIVSAIILALGVWMLVHPGD